ncbi:hypothetical protein SARC_16596 [Sphaeroforma arctica JP610]|uniref:Uncharacterized protein n=1 Tax=Sphaeroforma arctica JP610 TaxID=667725 RepID=A0A0L0F2F8_9EUKA|nr:hypothetical protein SARC_16596 [Sphaeroforma arctica JP610]KNC70872.1 hypothetical protein SARC_16596 [Sphaeroforma arctica JP610]|eukprot:XP_014144774.1 hypothetical protein SARC_16596 [Sphaeroforma arctica JP610]
MAPDVRYYREQPSRSLNRFTSTTDSTPSREILLGDSMVAINRTYDQIPTTTNTPTQSKTRASPNQQNSSGGGLAHSKTGSQENLTHPNPNSESDLIGSHAQRRASALSWQRMSLVRRRSNSIGGKRVLRDMAPLLLDLCMPPVLRASVFDHVVCEGRACVCDRVEEGEPATQGKYPHGAHMGVFCGSVFDK